MVERPAQMVICRDQIRNWFSLTCDWNDMDLRGDWRVAMRCSLPLSEVMISVRNSYVTSKPSPQFGTHGQSRARMPRIGRLTTSTGSNVNVKASLIDGCPLMSA